MKDLQEIKGAPLLANLLGGARIIKHATDGVDYHLLVEYPKDGQWRYGAYQTLRDTDEPDAVFHLMTTYNLTRSAALNEFVRDCTNNRLNNQRHRADLVKHFKNL